MAPMNCLGAGTSAPAAPCTIYRRRCTQAPPRNILMIFDRKLTRIVANYCGAASLAIAIGFASTAIFAQAPPVHPPGTMTELPMDLDGTESTPFAVWIGWRPFLDGLGLPVLFGGPTFAPWRERPRGRRPRGWTRRTPAADAMGAEIRSPITGLVLTQSTSHAL